MVNKKIIISVFIVIIILIALILFVLIDNNHKSQIEKQKQVEKQIELEKNQLEEKTIQDKKIDDKIIKNKKIPSFRNIDIGKTCPNNLSGILTNPIVNPNDLVGLIPLGNLNPPTHTFPVDHIYFTFKPNSINIPVYHPADGYIIYAMSEIRYDKNTQKIVNKTYEVSYSFCNGIEIQPAGLKELSQDIIKVLNDSKKDCHNGTKYKDDPNNPVIAEQCYYYLNYSVKAGDLLGYTDDLEIWAYNFNSEPRQDINWDLYHYEIFPYTFCTFDLYSGDLKKEYYNKFGFINPDEPNKLIPRTIEPICGSIVQDIIGTVQGDWFGDKEGDIPTGYESKDLALVYDNYNPKIGVISIGGFITNIGKISFIPKESGNINRRFSDVKTDNKIYCYYDEAIKKDKWVLPNKKFIVQLINNNELRVEVKDGNCTSNEQFTKPYTYIR